MAVLRSSVTKSFQSAVSFTCMTVSKRALVNRVSCIESAEYVCPLFIYSIFALSHVIWLAFTPEKKNYEAVILIKLKNSYQANPENFHLLLFD